MLRVVDEGALIDGVGDTSARNPCGPCSGRHAMTYQADVHNTS